MFKIECVRSQKGQITIYLVFFFVWYLHFMHSLLCIHGWEPTAFATSHLPRSSCQTILLQKHPREDDIDWQGGSPSKTILTICVYATILWRVLFWMCTYNGRRIHEHGIYFRKCPLLSMCIIKDKSISMAASVIQWPVKANKASTCQATSGCASRTDMGTTLSKSGHIDT